MIKVHRVTQHFGVRPVLRDLTLEVRRGELIAVMGPNGMGKSTLLGVIAGILPPQKGYVEIDGLRRRRSTVEELRIRRQVVYLPDHPWLPASRTAREFLVAVGRLYDIEADRLMDHVERLLSLFHLEEQADAPIRTYSNGQKKKTAIAATLVTEAPVMILDEPFTGGLDPSGILALRHVLKRLADREDVTIVMASQVSELVEALADRIAVLREGKLVACDTIQGLQGLTAPGDSLATVLEKLIQPQSLERIEKYFAGADQ